MSENWHKRHAQYCRRKNSYADAIRDYNDSLARNPRPVSSLFGRGLAEKRSSGEGSADIKQAKDMDHTIASEFASYGVNECAP